MTVGVGVGEGVGVGVGDGSRVGVGVGDGVGISFLQQTPLSELPPSREHIFEFERSEDGAQPSAVASAGSIHVSGLTQSFGFSGVGVGSVQEQMIRRPSNRSRHS